jgi:hypothetical protein
MMLVDVGKWYSQIFSLNKVGPLPNTLSWHFVIIVRECNGVWCWQDILLACGRRHGVRGFKSVNVCEVGSRVGFPRSSILSYVLRWSCRSCSLVSAFDSTLLRMVVVDGGVGVEVVSPTMTRGSDEGEDGVGTSSTIKHREDGIRDLFHSKVEGGWHGDLFYSKTKGGWLRGGSNHNLSHCSLITIKFVTALEGKT